MPHPHLHVVEEEVGVVVVGSKSDGAAGPIPTEESASNISPVFTTSSRITSTVPTISLSEHVTYCSSSDCCRTTALALFESATLSLSLMRANT